MYSITALSATEIIDSRGMPTVQVSCTVDGGAAGPQTGVAMVPSGASTGVHEALELRDGDRHRFGGNGVLTAIHNVQTTIAQAVVGQSFDQASLDAALIALDGTPNKAKLGANAILGVSMAFARAAAQAAGVPLYQYLQTLSQTATLGLPQPAFNVINGGKHADSGLDIQEYMIIPSGFPTLRRKVQAAAEVIAALKHILYDGGYAVSVGDEGGFAPKLGSNERALDFLVQAITAAGYSTEQVQIGLDVAASSLYTNGAYKLTISGVAQTLTRDQLLEWYHMLISRYPIVSIEDPFAEDDWDGFTAITAAMGKQIHIVGDDLLVTNVARIQTAFEKNAVTAVLIKPNQIGTLTETLAAIALAQQHGLAPFVSHRSGETTDTFIADLAVAVGAPYIKAGSLARGERVCKYNRLMAIEAEWGK